MISRFLALFVLVGTTFAQTATPPTAATVEVWPEGKMQGNGAKEPEAEVPRKDGFHRITNVSRPTLKPFPAPRKAGAAPQHNQRLSWRNRLRVRTLTGGAAG